MARVRCYAECLIGAPEPMSIEAVMAAPNSGGYGARRRTWSLPGSEFNLVVGDRIVVPFQAVTGDVWHVQLAGTDLERVG